MLPNDYQTFVDDLERLMTRGRRLKLYRTTQRLHKALRVAREERFEAAAEFEIDVLISTGEAK